MPIHWFAILAALAIFVFLPVVWAWRLALLYERRAKAKQETDFAPRAAVILSLRGGDPSLTPCLERLLEQDYPDYSIWIVIDNRDDPAWALVDDVIARAAGAR